MRRSTGSVAPHRPAATAEPSLDPSPEDVDRHARAAADRARLDLHWWRELLIAGTFYLLYSGTRNLFGSAGGGSAVHALHNADRVIALEQRLGLFHEQAVQSWFLGWPWFLRFWNVYYGTLHFVITIAVLLVLFRRWPTAYRLWRNTLAATTALALLGFSLFPLMPPRLLCACTYGGGAASDRGFVDTLERFGGLWSFDSGTMKAVSNQYAAMPSLHVAWALWCACVLVPRLRHRWAKLLAVLYPVVTVFAVVVTANHYLLDALGGAAILAVGFLLARFVTRLTERAPAPNLLATGVATPPP